MVEFAQTPMSVSTFIPSGPQASGTTSDYKHQSAHDPT